jgi:hypothetical protein
LFPDVPVTLIVYVPDGVEFPDPPQPITTAPVRSVNATPSAIYRQFRRFRSHHVKPKTAPAPRNASAVVPRVVPFGNGGRSKAAVFTPVRIVRVAVVALVPFGVTEVGLIAHVAFFGAPVQLRLIG